ncbi:hypothetical protein ABBQ38_004805 [Trebouxia sp. C0009 RCD-2024]
MRCCAVRCYFLAQRSGWYRMPRVLLLNEHLGFHSSKRFDPISPGAVHQGKLCVPRIKSQDGGTDLITYMYIRLQCKGSGTPSASVIPSHMGA